MSVYAKTPCSCRPNVWAQAFFLLLAVLPWLNPVSGGAMTPAIPLLVGWVCCALLFAAFPVRRLTPGWLLALVLGSAVTIGGVILNSGWQLLAFSLFMMGLAALVAVHIVQAFVQEPQDENGWKHQDIDASDWHQTGVAWIAWSWLLAGVLNALAGYLQYRQQTVWLGGVVNHAPAGQVYGNLRQRNQFATLMTMALWALWFLWQQGHLLRVLRRVSARLPAMAATVVAWLLMAILTGSVAMTMSRTGLTQLVVTVTLWLFWVVRSNGSPRTGLQGHSVARRQLLAWLVGVVLVYATVAYALPLLRGGSDMLDRLAGQDSRACISRTVLWRNVLQLIGQKPLLGWGWGELDFAHYHAHYPGMRFCDMLDNAHNLPLHLAVELGIPAAVLVCAAVAWWVMRNRPWAEAVPARQLAWGVLLMIGLHSMLEYPLWYAHFQMAFGMALGILWATRAWGPRGVRTAWHAATVPVRQSVGLQHALAAVLVAGLAYACFDYVRVTQLYMMPEDRVWPFRVNTLQQAERSWLYRNAVHFAHISMAPVSRESAQQQLQEARKLMHYSPEARVVKRTMECLQVLGRKADFEREAAHFREVYPTEYAKWRKQQAASQ